MAAAYWGSIAAMVLWSLNKLVQIPTSPAAHNILPLAAFAAATAPLSLALVRWIAARSWPFIPADGLRIGKRAISRENLVNVASLLVLAPFMLAAVALGALAFERLLSIPAGSLHKFVAYLFYLVANIVGAAVTGETLRAFREYAKDSSKR
jgi:hypothetical protein